MSTRTTSHHFVTIKTARVLRADNELINAIVEAAKQSNLSRDRAQGKLSMIIVGVWDEADARLQRVSLASRIDGVNATKCNG